MPRPKKSATYLEQLEQEVQTNQSKLSLILGALIVIVLVVLVFNYFQRQKPQLGPAQQTQTGDVSPENLPGKYTVKEGDTLFQIADYYYKDGYKYIEIVKANNLTNENAIEIGQVLEIPKLAKEKTPAATLGEEVKSSGPQDTVWGPAITGETYTVVEGDWLSTIAARSLGEVMAYPRLAEANNLSNPDLILPGQVLKIPR